MKEKRMFVKVLRYLSCKTSMAFRRMMCLGRIKWPDKRHKAYLLGRIFFFGRPDLIIGSNSCVWPHVSFAGDGRIEIGSNCQVGKDTDIYASAGGGCVHWGQRCDSC